jgi:poly(3-hydroxybutyrate) depolymerase
MMNSIELVNRECVSYSQNKTIFDCIVYIYTRNILTGIRNGKRIALFTLCFLLLQSMSDFSLAKEVGFAKYSVNIEGKIIQVFAYHPAECIKTDILVVFHGLNRKAQKLRDATVPVAMKYCLTVYSPLFDKQRFPNWRYHRAGVFRNNEFQPRSNWTGPVLHTLLSQIRDISGKHADRLFLFGHSAGAQFLSRIAAYSPPVAVSSIVVANPSLYVLPSLEKSAPEGFKGLFSEIEARRKLKAYLALPISIYLGQRDTGSKYLVKSKEAMTLGHTRLERGRNIFNLAQQTAHEKNWEFNWKLVEVPQVGHSSSKMLQANELLHALRFYTEEKILTGDQIMHR